MSYVCGCDILYLSLLVYKRDIFTYFQFADIGEGLSSCNGFVRCSHSQF